MFLNKSRAEQVMEKNGLDGLVATTPENVAYLTGFWVMTSWRHRSRQVYAVISKKEMAPDLIISRGLVDHPLQGGTWPRQYYVYGEFYFAAENPGGMDAESRRVFQIINGLPKYPNAVAALVQCLKDNGLHQGRIGVDQGSDTVFLGETLEKQLPGLRASPAYDLFREIRAVKTPEEVGRIHRAAEVAERALSTAISAIGEGLREKDLDRIFKETVFRQGGIPTLSFIGGGPRGAFPNVEPSERKIRKGDLIRFDVGCLFEAYHSDIARTAVLGPPDPKQQRYHDALVAGQGRVLEALNPGVRIADLFHWAMAEARAKGIPHYERHHVGHGTGIEGYDLPLLTPGNAGQLESGMVLCVETPYYEPGFGGLQVEDILEITADGARRLTQLERKLFIR